MLAGAVGSSHPKHPEDSRSEKSDIAAWDDILQLRRRDTCCSFYDRKIWKQQRGRIFFSKLPDTIFHAFLMLEWLWNLCLGCSHKKCVCVCELLFRNKTIHSWALNGQNWVICAVFWLHGKQRFSRIQGFYKCLEEISDGSLAINTSLHRCPLFMQNNAWTE